MASPESSPDYGDDRHTSGPPTWLPHVRYTTSWHTVSPIDIELPCTATEDRTCQIVHHLPVWNEMLYCIHYELRECSKRKGQLSLVSLGQGRRYRPSVQDFMDWHKANNLLSCLLKNHRCIDSIELLYWDVWDKVSHPYDNLFCDAFSENESVKTLSITFSGNHRYEKVCALIASCGRRLERLECHSSAPAALFSALTSLLRTTTHLTVLKIGDSLRISEPEALNFLAALRQNTTLKELSMRELYKAKVSLLSRSEFTEYLENSRTLTALDVSPVLPTLYQSERWWLWILEGLSQNRTISDAKLGDITIGRHTSPIIAKIFAHNATLRSLSMTSLMNPEDFRIPTVNTSWLEAFMQNETIEEISLDFHMLSMAQWEMLLVAVARKQNITKVTVKIFPQDNCWLPKLFRLLREGGVEDKIFFETECYFVGDRHNTMECRAFSEVRGFHEQGIKGDICRALQRVPSLHHITSLSLRIPAFDFDDSISAALGQCVKAATSLRKLRLIATRNENAGDVPHCPWEAVVSSFHDNTSLEEIFVAAVCIRDEDIECLADAVKFSTVLRTVEFKGESSDKVDVFFRRLAMNIAQNYSLTSVNFLDSAKRNTLSFKPWYTVWEAARRNRDLLELAAVFVSGIRSDRPCASALEKVAHIPALVEKVASAASVSNAEADSMIRLASARLKKIDEFMKLTGVVRDRVVCHPRGDGRLQLDDLNHDCWSSVRRFLSLDDIKDCSKHEVRRVGVHVRDWRLRVK